MPDAPAAAATRAAIAESAAHLPLDDAQDFDDATRGLLGKAAELTAPKASTSPDTNAAVATPPPVTAFATQ